MPQPFKRGDPRRDELTAMVAIAIYCFASGVISDELMTAPADAGEVAKAQQCLSPAELAQLASTIDHLIVDIRGRERLAIVATGNEDGAYVRIVRLLTIEQSLFADYACK